MFSCRVLVGPIATDKEYRAGDTVCLDKKDADTLASYGLVEIIGEVEAKFVPEVVPVPVPEPVTEAFETPVVAVETIAPEAVIEAVTPEPTAAVETEVVAPVETAPVIETEVVAPVETTPVVEVPLTEEISIPVEAAADEAVIIDGEEALGLEEVTTTRRRK